MLIKLNDGTNLDINNILIDFEGVVSVTGSVPYGVKEGIQELQSKGIQITLIVDQLSEVLINLSKLLGVNIESPQSDADYKIIARNVDLSKTAYLGCRKSKYILYRQCALKVAVLQAEGLAVSILPTSDILVKHINDAIDLLIYSERIQNLL